MNLKKQLFGVKLKTVKDLFVLPFPCSFTNIFTLKLSYLEKQVVGYEYVNEKARKEWWRIYGDWEALWNLECWYERYVKQYNAQNMRNFCPIYIEQIIFSCTFILLL